MAQRVLTAPLAVIKVNGKEMGIMQNLRITENLQRGTVTGIGSLLPKEKPVTSWQGSFSCQLYNINFREGGVPGALRRDVPSVEAWVNNVLLDSQKGVQVVIYQKDSLGTDPQTGLPIETLKVFATINTALLDRDGFSISENQVSGRDQEFTYLTPILFID